MKYILILWIILLICTYLNKNNRLKLKCKILELYKHILCLLLGHIPIENHDKDIFGYEFLWQKVYCKRCGKRLN